MLAHCVMRGTMQNMTNPHNLYIHTPFCMSKCNYCAFFSRACSAPDWDAFADGISHEIEFWGQRMGRISVPTVFFGGGTPSLMPTKIFGQIMNALRTNFDLMPDAEITLESNPKTLDKTRLCEFVNFGVNRLSVGIQRLNDKTLQFLGRTHSVHDALELLDTAHKCELRLNADFIYGLPCDTPDSVMQMCKDINTLGLHHVSMYELTIEPNTPFGHMNLEMPSNNAMADMYTIIGENLSIPRYEVSNYATAGDECRHNQNIWDGAPYIGIGRGAAGRPYIQNVWYEQTGGDIQMRPLSTDVRATEKIITGMRTMRGVSKTDDVMKIINTEYVRTHPELISDTGNRICATKKGILILDDLLVNLCN